MLSSRRWCLALAANELFTAEANRIDVGDVLGICEVSGEAVKTVVSCVLYRTTPAFVALAPGEADRTGEENRTDECNVLGMCEGCGEAVKMAVSCVVYLTTSAFAVLAPSEGDRAGEENRIVERDVLGMCEGSGEAVRMAVSCVVYLTTSAFTVLAPGEADRSGEENRTDCNLLGMWEGSGEAVKEAVKTAVSWVVYLTTSAFAVLAPGKGDRTGEENRIDPRNLLGRCEGSGEAGKTAVSCVPYRHEPISVLALLGPGELGCSDARFDETNGLPS